jgi:hypothetical protein
VISLENKTIDHLEDLKIDQDNVLLDVDLDYFSTKNPIKKRLNEIINIPIKTIEEISQIYDFGNYKYKSFEEFKNNLKYFINPNYMTGLIFTKEENYLLNLKNLTKMWKNDKSEFTRICKNIFRIRKDMLKDYYDVETFITSMEMMINLPYYISNDSEIDKMMNGLNRFLRLVGFNQFKNPLMTTIARSEYDGCNFLF